MLRFILLLLIGATVYYLWKWTMGKYGAMKEGFNKSTDQSEQPSNSSTKMSELVQCKTCKLYIAKDSAITYKNEHYCSEKCKPH